MTQTEQTDEAGFHKAIWDAPGDDTHRLAYADWLRDHGHERKADAVQFGTLKRFGVDFDSPGGALTLAASDVSTEDGAALLAQRTHEDGWTIHGGISEDYYTWVNEFEASHPDYGLVWGDFERLVFATSVEGFHHFYDHHTPNAWDYHDI